MKRPYSTMLSLLFVLLLGASCTQSRPSAPATPAPTPARSSSTPSPTVTAQSSPTRTVPQGQVYTDAKLGFQLTIPRAWQTQPQPGSQASPNNAAVTFTVDEQCTELVNRLLYERWALPHLPGNAARYYDYYQDGVLHPGTIRTFPAGSYQLSDDASQGKSAFRPVAGDLLVFQDVDTPRLGWTSGLTDSPCHVAVIVGVDDAYVYVAQENYNDTQYFPALPIHRVATGYEITDLSGWSQRIVRGWIRFTVNGGLQPTS